MSKTDPIKSEEAKLADEVIHAILRAKKALRMYPSNNPIYAQTVKDVYRRVTAFLDYADSLDLSITRNDIKLGSEVVYHAEGNEDNLALFFFRDGLRSLSITQGVDEEELHSFLDVISQDLEREDVEEDLVTLLWEKDFHNISYRVDESELSEDDGYEEDAETQAKEGANEPGSMQQAHDDTEQDEEPADTITPITITDEDLATLDAELKEDQKSKFPKLTEILFDMLYSSDSIEEFKDVSEIISNAVEFSIRHANLAVAINIFRRVREVHDRTKTVEAKKELSNLLAYANSTEIIETIGHWLDSPKGINEKVFKDYVALLDASSIPHFIALLGTLDTIAGRKAAIYALSVVGRKDFKALAKGLGDDKWFVVRNIVVTFKSMNDKRALDFLPRVLKHTEPRVVKETLKLMGEMGGPPSVVHIQEHLYSPKTSVAVVAAQALSKIGSDLAKAALIEKITSKDFQEMELTGMKPFFEALAKFRSLDVFEFLMGMLDRSPFFGRAKYNEMKACAMYALGLMGSNKALPALEEQKASKDRLVIEYATTAIKRIQHVHRK